MGYDVFISHSGENKPWVEVLAGNLKTAGLRVFYDDWELSPGCRLNYDIYEELERSRAAVLVATPEAHESGWVKDEYETMLQRRRDNPNFRLVPVVIGESIPEFPFLKSMLWVDFRETGEAAYRRAFHRLLSGLKGRKPESDSYRGELRMPPEPPRPFPGAYTKTEKTFLDDLFEKLYNQRAIILLAQADGGVTNLKTEIKKRAKDRYGDANVSHIDLPYTRTAELPECFSLLGEQCGFPDKTSSPVAFMRAVEGRLKTNRRFFLLVTGFENGADETQREVAGVLRGLNNKHDDTFRVVICGGEKLADLYYAGTLSYLNDTEAVECPEIDKDKLSGFVEQTMPEARIPSEILSAVLEESGGHPPIIRLCLDQIRKESKFDIKTCRKAAADMPAVCRLFTPFYENQTLRKILCDMLMDETPATTFQIRTDPIIKNLYWANAMKKSRQDNHLRWRNDIIRETGRRILGCESGQ